MPHHIHPNPFVIHPSDDLVHKQPELRRMSSQLADLYATGNIVVKDEHLQAMGSALWSMLEVDDDFDAAVKSAGAAILSIIIESGAADVQALPWETLFHPTQGFIGKNPAFTLTRQLAAKSEAPSPLDQGPLRVLLFTSLPADVDAEKSRLKVEEEQAQVQEALLPWISKGAVKLEMPDDGRFSTLQELLKSFQPHVLFLSGHGSFHHEPHTGEAPYGEFFFESEIGDSDGKRGDEIAEALIGSGAQAVILSACESSKSAPASESLNNGLAQRISAQGIPHVIGMRESILDRAGIQFARALCDALANQEHIDFALQAARIAIQTPFKDIPRKEAGAGALAELSLGQWCLPMLISSSPRQPLIDWDFPRREVDSARLFKNTLGEVSLPARFVGRRAELRRYENRLLQGKFHSLLITAPGGQGKTSLAGKLALDLQKRGAQVFAWSARKENSWQEFEFKLELALDEKNGKKYDHFRPRFANDMQRAQFMLNLLMEQCNGRVILFLDNLESIQDPDTQALQDETVAAWMQAAQSTANLILLATSRWLIPNWDGEHLALDHANYGDFLQMAQGFQLPATLFERRKDGRTELRRAYETLGGNPRGLEFFAAAVKNMQAADEDAFLEKLAQTKADLQADMAIEAIYNRLPAEAQKLLGRLPAYHEPVPLEGLVKLGLDFPDPEALLERLLAVSLLEAGYEPHWQAAQYQCAPMVSDWMGERGLTEDHPAYLNAAADYHLYLRRHERRTLSQAVTAHGALRRAGRDTEADRLTLDTIVGPLTLAGFYATLLTEWLPRICKSQDLKTRAEALGQTGKILHHLGDFQNALPFMKQSLTIMQQIGDKAGEGATLNNISQIYDAQGDYETALGYLKQSLTICQQIGDKAGEGATLNNISQIFKAQGDYETALGYLKQSLTIRQQIGDKAGEATTLGNIGTSYHAQGDYETALGYLKQSLTICQQIGDKAGEGATLNNISQIYHAQGDYETALGYLKQSLTIRQQIGDKAGLCVTLFNMGHIHAQNKQMQEAVNAWVNVYIIAKPMGLANVLQALSQLAPQLGLPEGLAGWEQLAQRMKPSTNKNHE